MVQPPKSGQGRFFVEVSRSHTQLYIHTHTYTAGRTPLNEWQAGHKDHYLQHTQQTRETNTHALSGVRNRNPSNQAAAGVLLRPYGHRDRRRTYYTNHIVNKRHRKNQVMLSCVVCPGVSIWTLRGAFKKRSGKTISAHMNIAFWFGKSHTHTHTQISKFFLVVDRGWRCDRY